MSFGIQRIHSVYDNEMVLVFSVMIVSCRYHCHPFLFVVFISFLVALTEKLRQSLLLAVHMWCEQKRALLLA